VRVVAVKRPSLGDGLIVRLQSDARPDGLFDLGLDGRTVRSAVLCDAREAELGALAVERGVARVALSNGFGTVRLVCA
jgi:hypothetical protein